MRALRRTQFGDPILRQVTKRLSQVEIQSDGFQKLIGRMRYTLENKEYGVGLAAPQVGKSLALILVGIKPTPSRPKHPTVNMVLINPEVIKTYGGKEPMWEGCLSFGGTKNFPYAQVPRYKKVRLRWQDENATSHERDFDGLLAHVLQHEVDHLNGVLFVDRVEDTKSYMTIAEYKKRYLR
ncbi:MAG: def [Candidatus Saccharibacteria bacterium]|nr:def [Candidatus Saccharibacteria bacterium]